MESDRKTQKKRAEPGFHSAFGRALKVLRAERGLERKELAEMAGLSYPYLSELETGRKSPSTRVVMALARALQVSPSALLAEAEDLQAERWVSPSPRGRSRFFHQDAAASPWTSAPSMAATASPPGDRAEAVAELEAIVARMSDADLLRLLDLARRFAR